MWNLGSTAIDENRLYESRLYVQFSSSETWKRSFFKEAYHWRVDLDFVSKCIENALDLRIIDLQLSKPRFHLKKVFLSICWDWKCIIYYELLSQDKVINFRKYSFRDKWLQFVSEKKRNSRNILQINSNNFGKISSWKMEEQNDDRAEQFIYNAIN